MPCLHLHLCMQVISTAGNTGDSSAILLVSNASVVDVQCNIGHMVSQSNTGNIYLAHFMDSKTMNPFCSIPRVLSVGTALLAMATQVKALANYAGVMPSSSCTTCLAWLLSWCPLPSPSREEARGKFYQHDPCT